MVNSFVLLSVTSTPAPSLSLCRNAVCFCFFFCCIRQTLIPKLEMRLQGVGASEAQYEEQVEALQVG